MKAVYLKNFRKGPATNSSSTHSVIYKNKDDMFEDLHIFEFDYYDRFDRTIAASKNAKIKYIAANIRDFKLFEIMSKYYPEMEKYNPWEVENGMTNRGDLYFSGSENLDPSIDILKNIIDDDDIVIIGGSDEEDFVYDTTKNHKEVNTGDDVATYYGDNDHNRKPIIKNGNYWIGYGYWANRLRFSTTKDKCIPSYPELLDLKITDCCNHLCPFCYQGSTPDGNHASFSYINHIIKDLNNYTHYKRRVEFAIGGGNALLHPQLPEILELLHNEGHIANITIKASDVNILKKDKKLRKALEDYVCGIGVSVSSEEDIEFAGELRKMFEKKSYKPIVAHLIPEWLGVEKTIHIIEELDKKNIYNHLFLGFKTNGRGATQKYVKFTNEDLDKLFHDRWDTGIDTTFANTYKDWLEKNYETEHTITYNEGEYSMYIDAVKQIAYKSSYDLEKAYPLNCGENEEWSNKGRTWFYTIKEAFEKIREDNGFEKYKPQERIEHEW